MKHLIPFCLSLCLFLAQGALIPTFAAVDENGNDTGNLNLTTQTLNYEDISNRESSTNLSASVSVSKNQIADEKNNQIRTETSQSGSVGFDFSDSHQLSKATIGQGTIKVGGQTNSDLDGLNRTVANATVDIKNTGTQLTLDNATLDVMLNPIQTAESIKENTQQIGILTKTAVKMVDAALEKDASLKEGADAVALGFNAVNNPAANARNKTDLAEKIANTETMTPEQLQEVTTLLFQEFQKQNLILDPATMKLVSTEGLTDAQIKQYHAATDVTTLQSFLNIQKTDITNGGSIYESVSAETIRQVYARAAKADPDATRNQALEEAVEQVAAGASKDTWNTFSNEQPTPKSDWNMLADVQLNKPVTHEDWIAKNKDSAVISAGNAELNQSKPEDVKPFAPLVIGGLATILLFNNPIEIGKKNAERDANLGMVTDAAFLATAPLTGEASIQGFSGAKMLATGVGLTPAYGTYELSLALSGKAEAEKEKARTEFNNAATSVIETNADQVKASFIGEGVGKVVQGAVEAGHELYQAVKYSKSVIKSADGSVVKTISDQKGWETTKNGDLYSKGC